MAHEKPVFFAVRCSECGAIYEDSETRCPACGISYDEVTEKTHVRIMLPRYVSVRADNLYAKMDVAPDGGGFTLEEEDLSEAEIHIALETGFYRVEFDEQTLPFVWIPKEDYAQITDEDDLQTIGKETETGST